MLGKSSLLKASTSPINDQTFVYEVEGLRQNEITMGNCFPIRNSSRVLILVPFRRMSIETQRISRLRGKIVRISSLSEYHSRKRPLLAQRYKPSLAQKYKP